MHADIAITNALIITVNSEDQIITDGTIIITGNTITDIGNNDILQKYKPARTIDVQGKLVMPGLVNCHTHAAMTMFRGMADDMPLETWLNDHIFPSEAKHVNAGSVELGTRLAVAEMLRSGTTCFADMYYYEDTVAEVCQELGIRAQLSEGVLGFPAPGHPDSAHALAYTEDLINRYRDSELISVAVGPHAPYTCPEYLMKECRELANKYNVPLHIHLSETVKEYEQCIEQTGVTPVQYLERAGILDGHTIAAHCVYASEEDMEVLKRWNTFVAHNPQCNMKLVSGVAPITHFLQAGITVGLGTDGAVSNNSLDMFEEMKTCALIHKLHTNSPSVMDAKTVVRMATMGGAAVLGMSDKIGSLEIGKRADIIMVNTSQPHLVPMYNVYSQLVYSVKGSDVETVIVNGRVVMDSRHISHIDELSLMHQMQQLANGIIQSRG